MPLTGTPKYWEGFGLDPSVATHVAYADLPGVDPGAQRGLEARDGLEDRI